MADLFYAFMALIGVVCTALLICWIGMIWIFEDDKTDDHASLKAWYRTLSLFSMGVTAYYLAMTFNFISYGSLMKWIIAVIGSIIGLWSWPSVYEWLANRGSRLKAK